MRWLVSVAAGFVLVAPNVPARAQSTETTAVQPAPEVQAPIPSTVTIPAGTTIVVEFTETLSSRTSQTGQMVGLRLVEPIMVNDQIVVAAGAGGGGEVIDAARSGIGGRNGKLIVSGRYIEVAGQRTRIRGLQVVIAGEDNSREAVNLTLVPYVGLVGGFITGGEIEIPAGTRAQARLSTDIVVPLSALPGAQGAPEQVSEVEDTQ